MRRIATTLTGAVLLAGALVAPAVADPVPLYAPYVQAAAYVESDGTLAKAKNVARSERVGTGHYCVYLSDPDIVLSESVVHANIGPHVGSIAVYVSLQASCNQDPSAITITTQDSNGTRANRPFYVSVQ